MGDKEAARVILQEVVSNGTEEQQAEANKMLERL
jgi:FimV-like protein